MVRYGEQISVFFSNNINVKKNVSDNVLFTNQLKYFILAHALDEFSLFIVPTYNMHNYLIFYFVTILSNSYLMSIVLHRKGQGFVTFFI